MSQKLKLVKRINNLANSLTKDFKCLDPHVCSGTCCTVNIDVPRFLINEYLRRNLANSEMFERGDTLSYRIKRNIDTNKCSLFDAEKNGCPLHQFNIKPPQCSVYPLQFKKNEHKCKNNVILQVSDEDKHKLKELEELFYKYLELVIDEFDKYSTSRAISKGFDKNFYEHLRKIRPGNFKGINENLGRFFPVTSANFSYECLEICKNRECNQTFETCNGFCEPVAKSLIKELKILVFNYVKKFGFKSTYFYASLNQNDEG